MRRFLLAALLALVPLIAQAAENGGFQSSPPVNTYAPTPYDYGALGDTQRKTCAVTTTAGQTAATIASPCAFAAADVGKYIVVNYAGALLTTSPVASIAVSAAGSAYTTVPTVSVSGSPGNGFLGAVNMKLATATVVTGGTGCTNSSQTFTVDGGTSTTGATITGTVTGNVLGGALTVTIAGSYSALPSTSAATLSGGGCATKPTISNTWSVDTIAVTFGGHNYPVGTTAALDSGNATLSNPVLAAPVAQPLATTIAAVTDATHVTLGATAGQTLAAASEAVTWGHDDSAALQAWINAVAGKTGYGYLTPAPSGYWGIATHLELPNGSSIRLVGADSTLSAIIALAPMNEVLFKDTGFVRDGAKIEHMTLDGNKLATNVVYMRCASNGIFAFVRPNNPAPYGANLHIGDSANTAGCNNTRMLQVWAFNDRTMYSGHSDAPLYAAYIDQTDAYWSEFVGIEWSEAGIYVSPNAFNTYLLHPHVWGLTTIGTTAYDINAYTHIIEPTVDGAQKTGIQIAGDSTSVIGGRVGSSSPPVVGASLASGVNQTRVIGFDTTAVSNHLVNGVVVRLPTGANNYVTMNPGAQDYSQQTLVPAQDISSLAVGQGALSLMTVTPGTYNNTAIGQFSLPALTTGNQNTTVGYFSGHKLTTGVTNSIFGAFAGTNFQGDSNTIVGSNISGSSSNAPTGNANTLIGRSAGHSMAGNSHDDTLVGYFAGGALTTGIHNTILGDQVGSTTLATGSRNLLLGTDSNCDAAASGTNDSLVICASSGSTPLIKADLTAASTTPVTFSTGTQIVVTTVANLPTCNGAAEGTRRGVSDANATTFHAAVAGSGSNHVTVYCDGTSWKIGG